MFNKVLDTIIVSLYTLFMILTGAFALYSAYALLWTGSTIPALVSMGLAVVCFGLAVFIARLFRRPDPTL